MWERERGRWRGVHTVHIPIDIYTGEVREGRALVFGLVHVDLEQLIPQVNHLVYNLHAQRNGQGIRTITVRV